MVLKALILVGGYGTRLRPLTFTTPKPLVDFVNKPIVLHQIEALAAAGVKHIILAVSYRAERLEDALMKYAEQLDIKIEFSVEDDPLGTAGPIALAASLLDPEDDDPFFMLNADISCPYPVAELLKFHRAHGEEGTIVVTRVDDPSKYGVVVDIPGTGGQIKQFVEKPTASASGGKAFLSDKINAGMYIFSKDIIKRIKPVKTSIERQIFPYMAAEGKLYMMELKGYWMDIGQPGDYLVGQTLHLADLRSREPFGEQKSNAALADGESCKILGNVVIDPSAKIAKTCVLGPNVVIGSGCVVKDGARIRDSTIQKGTTVGTGSYINKSIVGPECRIGNWARLEDLCVLGDDVTVPDETFMKGVRVCPHKGVKTSHYTSGHVVL